MSFFQEEAFKDIVSQFKAESQQVGDWELYVKNKDFTVYRKPAHDRNPHLYQYRAIGGWSDVNAITLANVYLDLDFRKKWDKNMLKHQTFLTEKGYHGYHFEMKYPWPLSNRDYAYVIERKIVKDKEQEYQVILGESLPIDSFPSSKGVIRIESYMQNICITKNQDGCLVFMDYFDDPQVNTFFVYTYERINIFKPFIGAG